MPDSFPAPASSGCRRLTAAAIPVSLGLLACAGEQAPSGPPTTGPELLEAAIRYHDPDDRWPRLRHTLVIDQSRPDGSERRATVFLDAASSDYSYEEDTADGRLVIWARTCWWTTTPGARRGSGTPSHERRRGPDADAPGPLLQSSARWPFG